MKKFFTLICPILFASCLCFGGCRNTDTVFSIYADGAYENTLSERNSYSLSDIASVKEKIETESGLLLVLIGAPWCPYCASDIGPIDERFRESPLSDTVENILYIDVADSQISTETIMEFNRTYDWSVRTRIPCLMAIQNKTLVAAITDEQFTQYDDRIKRIDKFFSFLETTS